MKSHYKELYPREELKELVHSFWLHENPSDELRPMTVCPDSMFKIILVVQNNQIKKYFMSGFWTGPLNFSVLPNAKIYGCRLKILAPEYLLETEVASALDSFKDLDTTYLNIENFDLTSFNSIVERWQDELLKIKPNKTIPGNKLRLSQLLYSVKGDISASEVSDQIFWENRQINRYLNKYIGMSLKRYLNIQKVYASYAHIRDGNFFPEKGYFDQAHFIREVKKHTNENPSRLHGEMDDKYIQLKNIEKQ